MFILLVGFLLQFLEYDDPISMMLSIIDPYDSGFFVVLILCLIRIGFFPRLEFVISMS